MESWGIKTTVPPPHTHGLNGMQRVAQGTNQPFIYHISEGGGGAGSLHGKISGSIKFGGSLEAHQNSGVEVPGSNPASPTMILMRCRITTKKCRKSQSKEGNLPLRKKRKKKKFTKLAITSRKARTEEACAHQWHKDRLYRSICMWGV